MPSKLCIQDRLIFTQLRERDGRSAMPYVNVHGTDLYYEAHGRGEPLILLHNGLGSTKSFTKQVPEFSKSFRVVAYDRRGYGRSAHATSLKKGWLEESVDELSCFLDEIKVDRAHLCGICVGGAIALLFAVKNPSRVDRITVAGTCCFGEAENSPRALKLYPDPDQLPPDWLRELAEHHGEIVREGSVPGLLSSDKRRERLPLQGIRPKANTSPSEEPSPCHIWRQRQPLQPRTSLHDAQTSAESTLAHHSQLWPPAKRRKT